MGGRAEPPEGEPEGGAGGEDEFRPVVFDESFIRAARIQELSASERLSGAHRSVRRRGSRGGLPRQALALMLLIGFAFATAVYMGVRHPYPTPVSGVAANLSVQIIPLQPGPSGIPTGRSSAATGSPKPSGSGASAGTASGSPAAGAGSGASAGPTSPSGSASPTGSSTPSLDPAYAGLPNGEFLAVGDTGFNLPNVRHTEHFNHDQVFSALQTVQGYLRASSLDHDVLVGHSTDPVRDWISPGQYPQFDTSVNHPANDQLHEATGWMVRFDPDKVQLATDQVLVAPGKISYQELDSTTLQVTSDYTFLYALSPKQAASPTAQPSASATATPGAGSASGAPTATQAAPVPIVYFAVRRSLTYWLTPDDIAGRHVQLVDSVVQAGATSCDADNSAYLQPLFPVQQHAAAKPNATSGATARPGASPGATAPVTPNGIDPFDHNRSAWTVCGQLTRSL
ncbi:SCO2583 family membrane protein [Streptacidiphilus rugosus]|uniref:SCO2583 family membrane protein n=1 Tax=Streptacidiphilus rugosus TaxID=405783 RepID=UPI00068E0084|nr:hypothetical protein [Streptacidiphilus rugosus]